MTACSLEAQQKPLHPGPGTLLSFWVDELSRDHTINACVTTYLQTMLCEGGYVIVVASSMLTFLPRTPIWTRPRQHYCEFQKKKKKKNPCAMWDNFDEQNQLLASPFWATHFRTAWLSMCSKTAKSLLATDKSGITNGLCLKQMTASHHPAYHQVSSDTQQFPKCQLKNGGCSQWVQGKKITQCVGGESVSHGTFYLYSMTQAPS